MTGLRTAGGAAPAALVLFALLSGGCDGEASDAVDARSLDMAADGQVADATVDAAGPDSGVERTDEEGQAHLFSGRVVVPVQIELSGLSWQRLAEDPRRDWVPARIVVDGQVFDPVGLKLKGGRGSFREIHQKAGFKIDLDRYDSTFALHGLRKLTFNNMIQDRSKVAERMASLMFQRFGLPAARVGYAEIEVNGRNYGLYSHIETFDDDYFRRAFPGEAVGPLYEGADDADLWLRQVDWFDLDAGEDPDQEALRALMRGIDRATPTTLDALDPLIDWPAVRRFFAAEMLVGHWDGYAQLRNNYYVYRQASGQWMFLPWGTDQTFQRSRDAFKGPGRLFRMCVDWTACRVPYAAEVEALAEIVRSEDWDTEIDILTEVTEEAFQRDNKTPTRPEQRTETLQKIRDFIAEQPDRIVGSLDCLEGPDSDGDGVLHCAGDCDDDDPAVYASAHDSCHDEIDQDCNGFTDDGQFCAPCREAVAPTGAVFLLCHRAERIQIAELSCLEYGGHLASIHSQEEQDFITAAAFARRQGRWWLGLWDRYSEGTFEWHDGSPVDFTAWTEGEPNDHGGYEDCTCIGQGNRTTWNDLACGTYLPVICRLDD